MPAAGDLRDLHRRLRAVWFDPLEKPSAWENLTDRLEVLAVAAGIKPTHLNGRGTRSEPTIAAIESVAREVGVLTQRAAPHPDYEHRDPDVPAEYLAYHRDRARRRDSAAPPVPGSTATPPSATRSTV
jgi:hypothetical protein